MLTPEELARAIGYYGKCCCYAVIHAVAFQSVWQTQDTGLLDAGSGKRLRGVASKLLAGQPIKVRLAFNVGCMRCSCLWPVAFKLTVSIHLLASQHRREPPLRRSLCLVQV